MAKQLVTEHVAGSRPPDRLSRAALEQRMAQIEDWCNHQRRGVVSTREQHLIGICGELAAAVRYLVERTPPPAAK